MSSITQYFCDKCGVEDKCIYAMRFGTCVRPYIEFSLCRSCRKIMYKEMLAGLKGYDHVEAPE